MGILLLSESASADSLSFFNPNDITKHPNHLSINTQTLLANDAFSLEGLFDDFHGDFHHQRSDYFAVGDIRYDVGTYIDGLGYVGYTYRKEAVIETSSDTMLLVNQASNDLDLTLGKQYNLGLEIEGFEVHGVMFANSISVYEKNGWNIRLGGAVELLYGTETQHGNVSGDASAVNESDYDFTLHSRYLYTENYLYELDVDRVTSYGYTTHISLFSRYNDFSLSVIVNDISGKLYWKNLPYSDVNMASGNKSYDENGYVKYAPVISGIERTTKFTQTLMKKWRIEGAYILDEGLLQLGSDHIYSTYLPYVKYTHHFENEVIASASYESYFDMVGVDIAYKYYHLGVHTNGLIEPSALKINLGMHYTF